MCSFVQFFDVKQRPFLKYGVSQWVVDLAKDPRVSAPCARSTTPNSKLDEALVVQPRQIGYQYPFERSEGDHWQNSVYGIRF